ncbi:MAG: hypothetical protein JWP04_3981 [Belnapia sp.]|nr:hypothetical protein [Belnapia sp.]
MPFSSANLAALVQGNAFTLWQYRTTDTRSAVTAAGYFAAVAGSMRAGDLMVLQTTDAVALVPIRSGPTVGTGVTLDGAVGPVSLVRTAGQNFSLVQAAAAVVRSIILAPLAAGLVAGSSIPVSATIIGPIGQVVFSLRDSVGAVVPPVQVVTVTAGTAAASFTAPAAGSSYRIRVEDAVDPVLGAISGSFSIGTNLGALMLLESDGRLLSETGDLLQQ